MQADDEPKAITFNEAIECTQRRTRHLLLGNGFSISARPSFSYPSLFRRAGPFSEPVAALFRDRGTEDFEHVLSVLKQKIEDTSAPPSLLSEWKRQEDEVRGGFIQSLQRVHPDHAAMMGPEECERCIGFLEHFVGNRRPAGLAGRIYTTNYDLLLYWVLARSGRRLPCYDSHDPSPERSYGLWQPAYGPWHPRPPGLIYLHGALHFYDRPGEGQEKLRYDGHTSLITQARARLDRGKFPEIVSEGTSEAKQARIGRSAYLKWASRYLRSGLKDANGVLFTFGHGLNERDRHLLKHVGTGRTSAVYVGAWGGLDGDQGDAVREWARTWRKARGDGPRLAVYVYDTATFSPWR